MSTINWGMFSELHELTDKYTLRAEELSANYYANLQMMKEERDCYSHLCFAFQTIGGEATDKEMRNAEEALGHQYRALYDSMDWLSLVIRQEINRVIKLRRFTLRTTDILQNALLSVKNISFEIGDLRHNKDMRHITDEGSAITLGIRKYMKAIDDLENIYKQLLEYKKFKKSPKA